MGWNSWNTFGCNISEALIRETADAMVSSGMRDAGYAYVNIDDCWHGERDANGVIRPNPRASRSGIKALADYVHAHGLQARHLLRRRREDLRRPSRQPGPRVPGRAAVRALGRRLPQVRLVQHGRTGRHRGGVPRRCARRSRAAGRPIVFSICEWGDQQAVVVGRDARAPVAHDGRHHELLGLHSRPRVAGAAAASCRSSTSRTTCGARRPRPLERSGHDGGRQRAGRPTRGPRALRLWAMLAAPLIAGNDVRSDDRRHARDPDATRT